MGIYTIPHCINIENLYFNTLEIFPIQLNNRNRQNIFRYDYMVIIIYNQDDNIYFCKSKYETVVKYMCKYKRRSDGLKITIFK